MFTLMKSAAPISALVCPSAARRATVASWGVSVDAPFARRVGDHVLARRLELTPRAIDERGRPDRVRRSRARAAAARGPRGAASPVAAIRRTRGAHGRGRRGAVASAEVLDRLDVECFGLVVVGQQRARFAPRRRGSTGCRSPQRTRRAGRPRPAPSSPLPLRTPASTCRATAGTSPGGSSARDHRPQALVRVAVVALGDLADAEPCHRDRPHAGESASAASPRRSARRAPSGAPTMRGTTRSRPARRRSRWPGAPRAPAPRSGRMPRGRRARARARLSIHRVVSSTRRLPASRRRRAAMRSSSSTHVRSSHSAIVSATP